tara:strand:- start:8 stop:361 length:354 start_codon:yes stop_codon:yes gene_type:complete
MISLKKILYEVLNNYSVEVDLFIDKSSSTYDITNEIRALKGVTIVTIITPDDYVQKTGTSDEYIRLRIKFVTRGDANDMLQQFLDDILATSPGPKKDNVRILGVKNMKYREKTLKRL